MSKIVRANEIDGSLVGVNVLLIKHNESDENYEFLGAGGVKIDDVFTEGDVKILGIGKSTVYEYDSEIEAGARKIAPKVPLTVYQAQYAVSSTGWIEVI